MQCEPLYIIILIEALAIIPGLFYIAEGRRYRREMILAYFSPSIIYNYFEQFWSGSKDVADAMAVYRTAYDVDGSAKVAADSQEAKDATEQLRKKLQDLYDRRFGWINYTLPLIVLALVLLAR